MVSLKYEENNMEVKRICQWCGKPFIAKKTTTNYCSHQCASQGYKHRMRERRLELRELQDLIEVKSKLDHQDYFTFAQAAQLMGVSRQYIYKLVKEEKLRASRISARMSIIRRADIELMLKTRPYERRRVKRIRQFNYYSKKHIDAAFAKYRTDDALTEWYTPEEIEKRYGMTRVAIRSHIYRNNIPSKKEHGQIFYSKLHFDLSKKTAEEDSSEYYTVQEAMKKYNLTRDSVYGILQFHEIRREKKGRFVRFLKVEFDHIMGAR